MSAPVEPCGWFDREGVSAEERGESIGAHLEGCPSCRQRQAEIAELRADLFRIVVPPPRADWQRAVWQRIHRLADRRSPRRWLWLALPAAAAAALLLISRGRSPLEPPRLAVHFEHNPLRPPTRGSFSVGDTLVVEAGGLAATAELRIYGPTGTASFRCAGAPQCERRDDRLLARWTLPSIGQYRVIALTSRRPLPAPGRSLDEDLSAASASGAAWQESQRLEVW